MARRLAIIDGALRIRRTSFGQPTGLIGADEDADGRRVTLGDPTLDPATGVITMPVTVPSGAAGVFVYGHDGKRLLLEESGDLAFTRLDLANDPTITLLELRAAVAPDGKLGPRRVLDITTIPQDDDDEDPTPPDPDPPAPLATFTSIPTIVPSAAPVVPGVTLTITPPTTSGAIVGSMTAQMQSRAPLGAETDIATITTIPAIAADTEYGVLYTIERTDGSFLSIRTAWLPAEAPDIARTLIPSVDFFVDRSIYRPEGQANTFTPILEIPGLDAETVDAIQVTWADNLANEGAWHDVLPRSGEAGRYNVFSQNHPVTPGGFDAALFTDSDPRRVGKTRLRWRITAMGDWSAWSSALTVPIPIPVGPPSLAQTLPDIEVEVGSAFSRDFAPYFRSTTAITDWETAGTSWMAIDEDGLATGAVPGSVGSVVVTITATNAAGSTPATFTLRRVAVPEPPPDPSAGELPPPTAAMLAESAAKENLDYGFDRVGGLNRNKTVHTTMVMALGALAGIASARTYINAQLAYWAGGAFTQAGNRLPSGRGGVYTQGDLGFVCTVAIARLIPEIWDNLPAAARTRFDLVMKGLMATACWQNSDTNNFVVAGTGTNERRMDGGPYGRNRVINFTGPSAMVPLIVSAFLAGDGPGANATAFLDSFDRAAFAAQLQSAGIYDMWFAYNEVRSFDHDGNNNTALRPGPDFAQFQNAIRNYRYLGRGLTSIADIKAAAIYEINRMWSKTIKQGLTLTAGSTVPNGYASPGTYPPGTFGILEPASNFGGAVGRGAYVGRLLQPSAWPQWIAEGLAGEIGMALELDAQDGGLPGTGSGGGPRSAMTYACDGARVTLMAILTLIAQGQLSRADPALQSAFARQGRGIRDLQLRTIHGHRSFAKGGKPWGVGTNEDWIIGNAITDDYDLASLFGLWLSIAKPWYEAA